jgi:hypothetical protein
MRETEDSAAKQSDFEYYIPGMPAVSETPGRVEQFVTNLLRRRGPVYLRFRREGQ